MVRTAAGDGWVVTVDGGNVSPPANNVWFDNIKTAVVSPVSGPVLKGPVTWDANDYLVAEIAVYADVSLPTEVTTAGAMSVGDFAMHNANGKLYRKVQVNDENGDPVSPGAGNSFFRRIDQGNVLIVPNSIATTKLNIQVKGIKLNP